MAGEGEQGGVREGGGEKGRPVLRETLKFEAGRKAAAGIAQTAGEMVKRGAEARAAILAGRAAPQALMEDAREEAQKPQTEEDALREIESRLLFGDAKPDSRKIEREFNAFEETERTQLLIELTGKPAVPGTPEFNKQWKAVSAILNSPRDAKMSSQERSAKIAFELKEAGFAALSWEDIRYAVQHYETSKSQNELYRAIGKNGDIYLVVARARSLDPQADVAEILAREIKESKDPALKKYWEQYQKVRLSGALDDILPLPESVRSIAGEAAKSPERQALNRAVLDVGHTPGTELHMGPSNRGEIHFGDGSGARSAREIVFLSDGGKTSLYIFDKNADRQVRGPIDPEPEKVTEVLHDSLIDEQFSRAFRKYSFGISEKDPAKAADQEIKALVRGFLPPGAATASTELSHAEMQVISNVAFLLAQPDSRHAALPDKVRFLSDWQSRAKSSEQGFSAAQQFLQTQNLPASNLSLTEFTERFA